MDVKLTCKLFDNDAEYFIDPIISVKELSRLIVYRNTKLKNKSKVIYISNNIKFSFFLIFRFYKMLFFNRSAKVFIGIYEIPHGILALICAKILKKPAVISVIGNPKIDLRNKGLRGKITKLIYNYKVAELKMVKKNLYL